MKQIYRFPKWILYVIILILLIIPFGLTYYFLKTNNKQIIFYPKFEIKEIKNAEEIDINVLSAGINTAESILKKLKLGNN